MKTILKGMRVTPDVLEELDRRYPGLSPHQAIRKVLGMPATEQKKWRKRSRIERILRVIFSRR